MAIPLIVPIVQGLAAIATGVAGATVASKVGKAAVSRADKKKKKAKAKEKALKTTLRQDM